MNVLPNVPLVTALIRACKVKIAASQINPIHFMLCLLLLLPSTFPGTTVFYSESGLLIMRLKDNSLRVGLFFNFTFQEEFSLDGMQNPLICLLGNPFVHAKINQHKTCTYTQFKLWHYLTELCIFTHNQLKSLPVRSVCVISTGSCPFLLRASI